MAKAKTRTQRERQLRDAEARAAQRKQAQADANRLKATGADASVDLARDEKGKVAYIVRAMRKDVFEHLRERRALSEEAFTAVRAYENALRTAEGANTPERRPDHIRASTEGAPGQNISQAAIDASRYVEFVDRKLSSRDLKLLTALLDPQAGSSVHWRSTVQAVTTETNEAAQTARVRAMAENVADIRQMKRKEAA